jgi:hypothetical protein
MYKKIAEFFFLIGCIFLFSFNDFPLFIGLIPPLDAAVRDASFPFFILATFFSGLTIIIENNKKILRKSEIHFYLTVCLFILLSMIVNYTFYEEVCNSNFCSSQKIFASGLSTIIRFLMLILLIPIIRNIDFSVLIIYMKIGFIISTVYVFIEIVDRVIPFYFRSNSLGLIDLIQPYFHDRLDYDLYRTRGFAFEPSFLALYLITVLPFLIAANSRILLLLWFICFISSASLTAFLGLSVFLFYYNHGKFKIFILIFFLALISILLFNFESNDMISTITRVGSWVSAIKGIFYNPFFGVGPSMSGFWVSQYYPKFFDISFESDKWREVAANHFAAPTFASILTFIFDFGIPLFLFIIIFLMKNKYWNSLKQSKLAVSACLSLLAASFGMNTYAYWGYWVFLAILFAGKWPEIDRLHFINIDQKNIFI